MHGRPEWVRMHWRLARIFVVCLAISGSCWGHGDLHERILALSAEIETHPTEAPLYRARAELYREHREPERALADLEIAAKLDPTFPRLELARARVRCDLEQWQEAKTALDRQVASTPQDAAALVLRAQVYEELGSHRAAADDFSAAIAVGEADPDLFCARARSLAALGEASLDEAISGLEDGCHRLGEPISLTVLAIDLEVRAGRIDAALARLDRIIAASPAQERWLARRGDILAGAGRAEEAHMAYARALAELATRPDARRSTPDALALALRLRDLTDAHTDAKPEPMDGPIAGDAR